MIATAILKGGLVAHADEKTIEQNRHTVKKWMLEQNYSIEREGRDPGQAWAVYAVEFGGQFKFAASEPAGHPEVIAVAVTFDFSDLQTDLYRLPAKERDDLILGLWFKLLNLDIEFRPFGDPLHAVMFASHIYSDEMRRGVFWHRVGLLKRAYWMAQWTFQQRFNVPVSLPHAESDSVN
jgi:hypothetical protein